jgi:very-short-patch-repair endonuclease
MRLAFVPPAEVYDKERTARLNRFGIEVLRFTNLDVFENLKGVLHSIEDAIKHRAATSP